MEKTLPSGEIEIVAKHAFTIYPKGYISKSMSAENTWCKLQYITEEGVKFSATGINLPNTRDVKVALIGEWEVDKKYGKSFKVAAFDIVLPTSESGIVAYMKALKCGIGPVKARAMYAKFGENLWDVLESEPDKLTTVDGITARLVEKLKKKLAETRIDREIVKLFAGVYELSPSKIGELKRAFGNDVLNICTNEPYEICTVKGFGFKTVDKLARKLNFAPNDKKRLLAAINFVFDEAAASGHTCLPIDEAFSKVKKELNYGYSSEVVSDDELKDAFVFAVKIGEVKKTAHMLYSYFRYEQEVTIVEELKRLLNVKSSISKPIEPCIAEFESENNISLAKNQKDAVKSAFENQVNIITGGPGTGKTTIINAILAVHKKVYGDASEPFLMSPTGKAARRMTEATNFPAQTIHSAVSYKGNEEDYYDDGSFLEGNLFILDEVSMADLYITSLLLKKVPTGARLIFVGDPDQLPSVGCGNVLYELIRSEKIPTTKLNVIFRQKGNSSIITNAARIRDGNTDLIKDEHFFVYELDNAYDVFKKACNMYCASAKAYGLDNVILLNPYRDKGELNVNTFNLNLQHFLNPKKEGELTIKRDSKCTFRKGDKVMQMKNTESVRNGDTGYITRIEEIENPDDKDELITTAFIEFNDNGIEVPYTKEALKDVDLAYCTTVHKSQGSEYKIVIMVLSSQHETMLRRNIVYTGITRAKQTVVLITEKAGTQLNRRGSLMLNNAIDTAILNDKTDMRYSLLGDRIHAAIK